VCVCVCVCVCLCFFSHKQICDEGAVSISKALKTNASVTVLELGNNIDKEVERSIDHAMQVNKARRGDGC
jgi:hypothetical protein